MFHYTLYVLLGEIEKLYSTLYDLIDRIVYILGRVV